jgi:hypothetical protein
MTPPTSAEHRTHPHRRARTAITAFALATASLATGTGVATADTASPTVGLASTRQPKVFTPGPPLVMEGERMRPATATELDQLVARRVALGSPDCTVDFDDDDAVALVGGAKDTFVFLPWWNQRCGDSWVRVYPTNIDHFHLTYADPDVTNCLNPENEYGTPLGEIARGDECEPIDPVTEPRGFLHSMFAQDIIAIDRILANGFDLTPRTFTFERIKIVDAGLRVCFRLEPEGPWEAAAPPGPGDHPAQYCWPSLGAGTWDLSAYTSGSVAVTVTTNGDGEANYGIDNLWLSW